MSESDKPTDDLSDQLDDYLSRFETYEPGARAVPSATHVFRSPRERLIRGGAGIAAVATGALLAASVTVWHPASQVAVEPTPTPSATPTTTSLELSGAITGTLTVQSVVCTAALDHAGSMSVVGDIQGHMWMRLDGDPGRPAFLTASRSSKSAPVFNSYRYPDASPVPGVTDYILGFGATIDTDLPASSGPGLHIRGRIVCPPSFAAATSVAFTDAGELGVPGFNDVMKVSSVTCEAATPSVPGRVTVSGTVDDVAWTLTTTGTPGSPTKVVLTSDPATTQNGYADTDTDSLRASVANFDPARGVTINDELAITGDLPAAYPGPASFWVQGQIACPKSEAPAPSPTAAPTPTDAAPTPATTSTPEATGAPSPSPSA